MSIYYVSAIGCDCADGLTLDTAWKTVEKVNDTIKGGDEVRFRCGDTFYGGIRPQKGISPEQPTTYTSYGDGPRPVISLYQIPHPDAWETYSDNIYKINMLDPSKLDGNIIQSQINANAGFMKISDKIFYRKRTCLEELTEQWDFYSDNSEGILYVYSEDVPSRLSDDIKVACRTSGIIFEDHIKVCGLEICGTGAHGVNGVTGGAYISDCYFHEIGGSELTGYPEPNVRYGNCVEAWTNSHDVTVERCKFADVYDVAITMQGSNITRHWENMYFCNNEFWDCTQCFEIWSSGNDDKIGFVNCHFENNVCIDTGKGWGYAARPNKSVATPLLIYNIHTTVCDVNISGNIFANSHHATIFKSGGAKLVPQGYVIKNNTIIRPNGQDIIVRSSDGDNDDNIAFERMIEENNLVIDKTVF